MRDFGGRDRWLPTPGLIRDDRQASRPLVVGDVLDVPGFEALLEPVYWLVLEVREGELTVVAMDRGVVRGDLHLPLVVGAGEGMSGWTVRRRLVRSVALRALPLSTRRIGALHARLCHVLQDPQALLLAPADSQWALSRLERQVLAACARLLPERPRVAAAGPGLEQKQPPRLDRRGA